jgi:hypothetical protein
MKTGFQSLEGGKRGWVFEDNEYLPGPLFDPVTPAYLDAAVDGLDNDVDVTVDGLETD